MPDKKSVSLKFPIIVFGNENSYINKVDYFETDRHVWEDHKNNQLKSVEGPLVSNIQWYSGHINVTLDNDTEIKIPMENVASFII